MNITPEERHTNGEAYPNQPPLPWILSFGKRASLAFATTGGAAAGIYYLLSLGGKAYDAFSRDYIPLFLDILNWTWIFTFIVILVLNLHKNYTGRSRTIRTFELIFKTDLSEDDCEGRLSRGMAELRQFKKWFILFWVLLLCFYATDFTQRVRASQRAFYYQAEGTNAKLELEGLGYKEFVEKKCNDTGYLNKPICRQVVEEKVVFFPITSILQVLNIYFIFLCTSILIAPKIEQNDNRLHKKQSSLQVVGTLIAFLLISVLLASWYSATQLITSAKDFSTATTIYDAVMGLTSAIIIALFVARLDSKLIGLSSGWIAGMYGYSAIQPLYAGFHGEGPTHETILLILLIGALILKIYFFTMVVFLMSSGRLLNYLVCFPRLHRQVDSIFRNHYEIVKFKRADKYGFSILDKGIKKFEGEGTSSTKAERDTNIDRLRDLLSAKTYTAQTKPNKGKYELRIIDRSMGKERKICRSETQSSYEEILNLQLDAHEKIPHCPIREER